MATVHHIVPDEGKTERLPDGALVTGPFVIRAKKNGELHIVVVEHITEEGADEWVRVGKIVLARTVAGVNVKLESGVVVKVVMPKNRS